MKTIIFIFVIVLTINAQIPSSITYNGNPPNMNVVNFIENVDIPEEVFQCPHPFYTADSTGLWNYTQIAYAFFEYGIKLWNFPNPTNSYAHISECVAALVIVSGECQSPADTSRQGCTIQSGASGVFQTDFLRTIPNFPNKQGYIMNLCLSAYGAGYMAAPFLAATGKTCTLSLRGGSPASFYNCYQAKALVNDYNCPDPNATPGKNYTNFIGPFCHKSYASRWSPCTSCCTLFNGGGNSYQIPFPDYYYEKANIEKSDSFETICRQAATIKLT